MRDIENNIDTEIPKSGNINIFDSSSDTCEFCGAIVDRVKARAEFRERNFNASAIENGITKLVSEWANYKTRVLEYRRRIEREQAIG